MTTTMGLYDAKAKLSELVDRVASGGEEIIITRHGQPVARLVPETRPSIKDLQVAFEEFKELRKKCRLNSPGLPELNIKDLTREGLE